MSVMETFKSDLEKVAKHMLDAVEFTAGIESKAVEKAVAKAKEEADTLLAAAKTDFEKMVDDKIAAFKAEVVGAVTDAPSSVVADLGDKVSGLTAAPAEPVEPVPAPETAPIASEAETAPVASPVVATVIAETGAPAEHVEPAVQAHAEAVAAGSPPEVAHADALAAAAQAGAEPEAAVQIADSVATQPAV